MLASKTFTQCSAVTKPWAVDVFATDGEQPDELRLHMTIKHGAFKFGAYEVLPVTVRPATIGKASRMVRSAIETQAAYHPKLYYPLSCGERDEKALKFDLEQWLDNLAREGVAPYEFSRSTFFQGYAH